MSCETWHQAFQGLPPPFILFAWLALMMLGVGGGVFLISLARWLDSRRRWHRDYAAWYDKYIKKEAR